MSEQRVALVTNATHFVGQPAVNALLGDNFAVVAQDPDFSDSAIHQSFSEKYPEAHCIADTSPESIVTAVFER